VSPPWGQVRGQVKATLHGWVLTFMKDRFLAKMGSQMVNYQAPFRWFNRIRVIDCPAFILSNMSVANSRWATFAFWAKGQYFRV
jgi:hypothetical protein